MLYVRRGSFRRRFSSFYIGKDCFFQTGEGIIHIRIQDAQGSRIFIQRRKKVNRGRYEEKEFL